MKVLNGIDILINDISIQNNLKGNIALLCHSASVTQNLEISIIPLMKIFGNRLKALFGPQHGLFSNLQDNMVESENCIHPYFNIPVFSLYSESRSPADEMLKGIDTILVDLQDIGARVYTYIYTLTLLMEACAKKDIKVVVLDRPNPSGGRIIEGNILDTNFSSFVGRHPIPARHAMTIGEFALYANCFFKINCQLEVIKMQNWKRFYFFEDTGLDWVLPSPNLSTCDSAITFTSTVFFEGTNFSEGRGTTRALEIIGHPDLNAYAFVNRFLKIAKKCDLEGFRLRPLYFTPTFNKHQNKLCEGFQIHVTDKNLFRPWRTGQMILKEVFHDQLGKKGKYFEWKLPPYEYEDRLLPIDIINGTDLLRKWVQENGNFSELLEIENRGIQKFISQREDVLIYN